MCTQHTSFIFDDSVEIYNNNVTAGTSVIYISLLFHFALYSSSSPKPPYIISILATDFKLDYVLAT